MPTEVHTLQAITCAAVLTMALVVCVVLVYRLLANRPKKVQELFDWYHTACCEREQLRRELVTERAERLKEREAWALGAQLKVDAFGHPTARPTVVRIPSRTAIEVEELVAEVIVLRQVTKNLRAMIARRTPPPVATTEAVQ